MQLENEAKQARTRKDQIQVLLDKSTHDDELVDALRNELEAKQQQLIVVSQQLEKSRRQRTVAPAAAAVGGAGAGAAAEGKGKVSTPTASSAAVAQMKAQYEAQLQSQNALIASLRADLAKAQRKSAAEAAKQSDGFARLEKEKELQSVAAESEKRQQLVELYAARIKELDESLTATSELHRLAVGC